MSQGEQKAQRHSFDEFKLYYESTEKVTDRRLATNTWNYGLCIAIMIAVAALASWASSRSDFRLIMLVAIFILSGMGVLLCSLWLGQIRDFKELNDAKFQILNAMAPSIKFGVSDDCVSAKPFDREWQILKEKKAAQEMTSMQIIALRSSNSEFLVPNAFRVLFLLIVATTFVVTVINWKTLTSSALNFSQPAAVSASTPASSGRTAAQP